MIFLPALIVDLDGTLANVNPIRHLVDGPVKDFENFHNSSINCEVNIEVLNEVNKNRELGRQILVLSGRTERFRNLSTYWLKMHNVPFDRILLRDNLDFRADVVIKSEMFDALSLSYNVLVALDDRDELISLWKSKGVPQVLKVLDGRLLDSSSDI